MQAQWEVTMTSIPLPLDRRAGVAALALLLASVAWAQAPDRQSMTSGQPKNRQPTPSLVKPSENPQGAEGKSQSEDADRKMREIDRKANRVLRDICIGC
jgi:hypothetical protein